MMEFRTVKAQIVSILMAQAAGAFITKGSQKQTKGAEENLLIPRVTVYYFSGDFPRGSGTIQTDKKHSAVYRCELTVVVQGEIDLNVINNPASTSEQLAAALTAMKDLSDDADDKWDELFDNTFQILMNALNHDLGLETGTVTNMWITQIQKDEPLGKGEFVILTGSYDINVDMTETVEGETGTPGTDINNTINLNDDQGDNLGTSGTLGG